MEYEIILPNNKAKLYSTLTFFILLLNTAVFTYMYLNPVNLHLHTISRFGLIVSAIYIVLYLVRSYTKYFQRYKLEFSFLVLGVLWIVAGIMVFAFIMFVCAILGLYASAQSKIIFTKDQVIYPSFPSSKIPWSKFSNVMLKDDLLTIDFKNNKIFQSKIHPDSASINEIRFNEFCGQQIKYSSDTSREPDVPQPS
jgi:hypothetical protein